MKISILIPTVAKPSLTRMLQSLEKQDWQPGDEVLLLSDDKHDLVKYSWDKVNIPGRHLRVIGGPHRDWGHTPRNLHMLDAKGDFLCHLDDDDVASPTMLTDMRKKLIEWPGSVHMFRMLRKARPHKVWKHEGVLTRTHVSTQNIVHPNWPDTFGFWKSVYGGDADFIQETVRKCGSVLWHDIVTCAYNPPQAWSVLDTWKWLRTNAQLAD